MYLHPTPSNNIQNHTAPSCSRLQDSGEKSFGRKKCEKRAGAGERRFARFSTSPLYHTAVKRLSMREELRGNLYVRFGKASHMWLRLLAGKNREIFFVFQESSVAMNRKNKRNV